MFILCCLTLWSFAGALAGAILSFGAGAAFGWVFGKEIANHTLRLYKFDCMDAHLKFFEWWEKKTEGRSWVAGQKLWFSTMWLKTFIESFQCFGVCFYSGWLWWGHRCTGLSFISLRLTLRSLLLKKVCLQCKTCKLNVMIIFCETNKCMVYKAWKIRMACFLLGFY